MVTHNRFRPPSGGFTLIEVCFALLIFGAMAVLFATVFPIVLQSSVASARYSQSSKLCLRKLDQIRGAGYTQALTPTYLVQSGIADVGTNQGTGLPYTVDFTAADNLVTDASGASFLPQGSRGTISVSDYNAVNPVIPAGNVLSVTVAILWPGGGSPSGQYSVSTLISKQQH